MAYYTPRTVLHVPVDSFGQDAVITRADMLRAIHAEVERRFNLQREKMRTADMQNAAAAAKKMIALAEAGKHLEAAVKAENENDVALSTSTRTADAALAGV